MQTSISAQDLDLFGSGSMFELLCDVWTPGGRDVLARWLQVPTSPVEATARREAVLCLRDRFDLREGLALRRAAEPIGPSWTALREWLLGKPIDFSQSSLWTALSLSLWVVAVVVCALLGVIQRDAALVTMAVGGAGEAALALWLRPRVTSVLRGQEVPERKLKSLRRLCELVCSQNFKAGLLLDIQQRLEGAIQHLRRMQQMGPYVSGAGMTSFTISCSRSSGRHSGPCGSSGGEQ